jgi:single-stranded DNA-binding protein
MQKFPVNQATVAGLVTRAVFNEEANRANVTVAVNDGNSVQYTNVLISGEEKFKNFKNHFENALENLGKKEDGKQLYPLMAVKGEAFFSVNENNGVKNQNYTLIASGSLSDSSSENFKLTKSTIEMEDFRKNYNSKNSGNNELHIRGVIASDPKTIENAKSNFVTLSIAHNYLQDNKDQKSMFANVVVPTNIAKGFLKAGYVKGSKILLQAKPQSSSYLNKDGNKVYTFNLVTSSINHDLNNATTLKKAIESIEMVAGTSKAADRSKAAKNAIDNLKQEKGM